MSSEGLPKIKPLSNSNYPEWSGEMRAWLMRNGLWKLVSGKLPKPRDVDELNKWETKAEKAAGEIYLLVESDQRVHFRGQEDDPIQMWQLLEAAHLSKKPGARFNAYDDLFCIRKQDTALVDLGVRMEKSMQAIQNLRPATFKIEQLDEELQCMALIRALPDEYRHLSSTLLLMDKLDKTVILQAFRSEELNRQRSVVESVNRARAFGRGGAYSDKGRQDSTCNFCREPGHWKSSCPKLKAKIEQAKGRKAGWSEGAKKAEEEKAAVVTEFAGQASAVDEFEANVTSSNIFHWNTDTGATSHMTPHKSWIRNYTPYRVPIRLADSRVIYSEGVGSVLFRPLINGQLARDVEFARVLHVPALCNNLLSVLYLTRHKGIDVHIFGDHMDFNRTGITLLTASINKCNIGFLNGSTIDISESVHLVSMLPLNLSL